MTERGPGRDPLTDWVDYMDATRAALTRAGNRVVDLVETSMTLERRIAAVVPELEDTATVLMHATGATSRRPGATRSDAPGSAQRGDSADGGDVRSLVIPRVTARLEETSQSVQRLQRQTDTVSERLEEVYTSLRQAGEAAAAAYALTAHAAPEEHEVVTRTRNAIRDALGELDTARQRLRNVHRGLQAAHVTITRLPLSESQWLAPQAVAVRQGSADLDGVMARLRRVADDLDGARMQARRSATVAEAARARHARHDPRPPTPPTPLRPRP